MRVLCGLVTCAVLALVPAGRLAAAGTPSCTITWDGGTSGSWHTPSNWDPDRLPALDDVVCIPAAATVTHSSGTTAVATVLVDGTLALGASTLSVTSTAAPSRIVTLDQTAGGTLGGAATVLLTGSAANSSSWSGGSMAGPGTTRIASGAALTIIGSSARLLANSRSLENLGTVTWSGGVLHTVDGSRPRIVVGAGGLLDMSGDVHLLSSTASLQILNGGVLRKSAGSFTGILAKTSNDGVVEALSGNLGFTVPMKNSGTITVGAGAALTAAPVINSTGLIRGSGTIQGDVIAGGEVAPGLSSPGVLTVSGDYDQQSDARLRVELAGTTPGTEYDRLVVTGAASLGGVLTIESAPGFLPPLGTTFDIVTGSRSGQFHTVEGDELPNNTWYIPHYNPSGVQLIVEDMPPAPPPPPPAPPPPPPPAPPCNYSNSAPVVINDRTIATPYPSTITVDGASGTVTDIEVKLLGLSHTWPDDVDALLVGPTGQDAILTSDAGGSLDVGAINLTFDPHALTSLPNTGQLLPGIVPEHQLRGGRGLVPDACSDAERERESVCLQRDRPERGVGLVRHGRHGLRRGPGWAGLEPLSLVLESAATPAGTATTPAACATSTSATPAACATSTSATSATSATPAACATSTSSTSSTSATSSTSTSTGKMPCPASRGAEACAGSSSNPQRALLSRAGSARPIQACRPRDQTEPGAWSGPSGRFSGATRRRTPLGDPPNRAATIRDCRAPFPGSSIGRASGLRRRLRCRWRPCRLAGVAVLERGKAPLQFRGPFPGSSIGRASGC